MSDEAFPTYTRAEELADACVHTIGVTAGTIAAIALVAAALAHLPTTAATAVVIYALGMLAVFCFSAAYNLSRSPRRWLLRRCDHAAIFIKIAATYTPFAAVKMGGTIGFALLAAVWGIALAGAAAKLLVPQRFGRMSYVLYLAQGWTCVFTVQPLLSVLSPTAMMLLLVGGVLYTVGVVFHLSERLPYHNAIWHGFVLAASACHFAAVLDAVVLS
jgi:hemolysin III